MEEASTIKSFILGEFLANEDPANLKYDTPLVSSGVVDSLAMVRLTAFLEEQFGITIEAHESNSDNFETIDQMVALVRRKRGA